MASAGTVTVDFAAETARFTSELRKVNASIDSLGSGIDKVGALAKTAFAAFSVGAAVSQVSQLISKSLELGGAIADATKKAGISAEAFSELNFAAKLAGVSTEELSSAFRKFQTELAGGGEKIASLGVNLERFRALQPDRQFEALAQAVASIEDPALRAGAAVEVFGKSGSSLLPLFEQGAKGIRAAREEAQRLGITLSTEQANALDNAGDAVDKLKSAYESFAIALTARVAPALTSVFEKLAEITSGRGQSPAEAISARIAELDEEIAKRSKGRQVGRGGLIPGEDPNAPAQRVGRGGVPANLSAFLEDRAALLEKLGSIERQQKSMEAAASQATNSVIDPSARTFGTDAAAKTKELADLNRELNAEFNRNSAELNSITEGLLQDQLENFEAGEKRKRDIAAQYASERAAVEQQFQDFLEKKRQEEAQREFEVSQAKLDIFQGGLELIGSLATKDAKLQKKIAIAQATINTIRGVTFQLTNGDVYSAIPRAIAVGLFGAAQIAKIASTPETGGGSSSPSFGGGSGPTIGTQPTSPFNPALQAQQPAALQQPPVTQVIFNGLITPESKQAIVDVIREATDNDVIVIDQRSAQAQMFMPAQ